MRFRLGLLTLGLAASAVASPVTQTPAADWPQWRGLARDGMVPASQAPKTWPESWQPRWSVEIGEGYSSPVSGSGRLYLHSRRDPQEVVTAVDAMTGTIAWQKTYDAAFAKNSYASGMAKGPNATPLLADGRLFTLGVSGVFVAWDAGSGKELWRKDYSSLVNSTKLFCGTAASPVMAHGLVVVQVGSDVHGGQIVGLDPATGTAKWTWKGAGPGYASPFVTTIGETSQLITMTNGSVVGLDARTGTELWSIAFPDEWHENIVTPIWSGTRLIVSGTRQGTHAYDISKSGAAWATKQAWKNADVAMYMSSPVLVDGLVVGLSARRKGQFVALDMGTGELKWSSTGRDADHASVLATAGHIVYLTSTADLVVVKRGATSYAADRQYADVTSRATFAAPIFVEGDLVIRDATHVTRLQGK